MENIVEQFGRNAGEVWKALSTLGPLPETDLKETTKLQDDEFYTAIGWLARENKINKTGAIYKLGETNLTQKVGADAGKLWKKLTKTGRIDVYDLSYELQLDERDIYIALGWLARENKIEPKKAIPKDYQVKS
ncbi:MAG TPA: winged helix-turn-helix domain-containing protein [Candidatus Thermoplasmatota archaeon]|nr:winged helix-turn-helix domain-containing protein [Candidatus Thermoplasmatota archaeon]